MKIKYPLPHFAGGTKLKLPEAITVALLLSWVALLPWVLLLGWVALLGRWSLVGILLLAILHISIRVILLVHAFWRTLSTMTVLFPIIVFLAWVLLWWAWKTTTSQDVNSLFSVSSKAFRLTWCYDRLFRSRRFPSHALASQILLTFLIHTHT